MTPRGSALTAGAGCHRRAFTLIEVLATVALLGLVMSMGLIGLGGVLDAAAQREAVAIAVDVDARARIAARAMGRTLVLPAEGGEAIEVRVADSGESLVRRELPPGFVARYLDADGTPMRSIAVDAAGRTVDHAVELSGPRGARVVHVAGLTGLVREAGP